MQIDPRFLQHYRHLACLLAHLRSQDAPAAAITSRTSEPRTQLIVFPGSFNPPTLAHLAMLRQARASAEQHTGGRWQVYVALSTHIVDKEAVARLTLLDRVILLERVMARSLKYAGIMLLNRGLYVEQARGIRASFPWVRRLTFLVGFDKIVQILDPRYYADREQALRELFALADLLVAPREDDGQHELRELLARTENRPFAEYIHPLPLDERYRHMSSTRARAGDGERMDIVPPVVRDFLRYTRPYDPPLELASGRTSDLYAERTRALRDTLATKCGETSGGWPRSAPHPPQAGDSG